MNTSTSKGFELAGIRMNLPLLPSSAAVYMFTFITKATHRAAFVYCFFY